LAKTLIRDIRYARRPDQHPSPSKGFSMLRDLGRAEPRLNAIHYFDKLGDRRVPAFSVCVNDRRDEF
jgi:hypothetical protein